MPKLKYDIFEEFSNNQRDFGLNNSYLFSLVYSNRFFNKVACSRVIRQKMAICLQLRPTKNALIAIFAEAIFGLNAALHFPPSFLASYNRFRHVIQYSTVAHTGLVYLLEV